MSRSTPSRQEFTGTVRSISPNGTSSSGVVNYTVDINLDAQDARLKPDMTATADITTLGRRERPRRAERRGQERRDRPSTSTSSGRTGTIKKQTVTVGVSDDIVHRGQDRRDRGRDRLHERRRPRVDELHEQSGESDDAAASRRSGGGPGRPGRQLMAAIIEVRDMVKTYVTGDTLHARAQGRLADGRGGRVPRDHGTVGLGQVDAHEPARPARHAHERHLSDPRRRRLVARRDGARRGPRARDRLRLPVVQPAPAHDDHAQRHAAADLRAHARPRARGQGRRRDGGRGPDAGAATTSSRTRSPAARCSASPSPARSSTTPHSSSPTSRPATSTRVTGDHILATFERLRDQGRTIVLITHEPEVAEHADRTHPHPRRSRHRRGRSWSADEAQGPPHRDVPLAHGEQGPLVPDDSRHRRRHHVGHRHGRDRPGHQGVDHRRASRRWAPTCSPSRPAARSSGRVGGGGHGREHQVAHARGRRRDLARRWPT